MSGNDPEQGQCPIDIPIATQPSNVAAVPELLKDITAKLNTLSVDGDEGRKDLIIKCRALTQALETPRETMIRHCWAHTGAIAALNFGVDSGLWVSMARNGDKCQKATDLAASLGIDPILLCRIMRHLGAMGYLIETGEDEYKTTNFTKSMSNPLIGNSYLAMLSCTSAGPMRFHEFSRKRGWVNPSNAKDTSMMYAYGTDKDMFAWQQQLGYGTHFNDHMGGYDLGCFPWTSFYPVEERLFDGPDLGPEAPLLVDIGGNVGHDLKRFKRLYPNAPGKLILQDLPIVLNQIKDLDQDIIRMEYDFLTEQPIKGARAYYLHTCLHDWPDDICDIILARIKDAMKPNYSKLLINEHVIPPTGAYWEATGLDMVMLTLFSSYERTSKAWYNLIEKRAGLKIVKIWSGTKGLQSLIECELP